jgi:uncharacterized protein (DUF362 family)
MKTEKRIPRIELSRRAFMAATLAPVVVHLTGYGGSQGQALGSEAGSAAQSSGSDGRSMAPAQRVSANSQTDGPGSASVLPAGAVLLGLYPGDGTSAFQAAARRLDFSWLRPGDSVLIKVAVNSQFPHPSTTCVNGVIGMVQELKRRGAGKVIVADQAGVEHVRSSAKGRVDSTNNMFKQNGLAAVTAHGAETYFFDDQPFDSGYFRPTPPSDHHWPRGFYIPTVVNSVDHIVYMPRLGMHAIAGYTQAQKIAVGWLREDSRHDMHNDAQYFYEKYVEVNYTKEIASRIRMTVGVSEQVLLHGGPDQGTAYEMDPVLVLASTSLPNHDAVGASILKQLNRVVTTVNPLGQIYSQMSASTLNTALSYGVTVPTDAAGRWDDSGSSWTSLVPHAWERGITKDRALARGWSLSGGMPESIQVIQDGARLSSDIQQGVLDHGEGIYVMA